ncbi:hypothetical protein CFIMG_005680RA [Ceratocystis fimbriata CBS 114723]|uniref:Uncharacterized protein n=1 Tax=Ceratocystis fimbriata CBS 114723 TaxID=1035309 RepID=A0A2C5X2X6_9PEZI|nr:hypothetical protein CFIMG_005680RA [Ceratocystis fimbriata CBS 114723]
MEEHNKSRLPILGKANIIGSTKTIAESGVYAILDSVMIFLQWHKMPPKSFQLNGSTDEV